MRFSINDNELLIKVADITTQTTDAIVNAANSSLMGGGGVDGAIHHAAGPELLKECKQVRQEQLNGAPLPTGEAVITKGYNLPASYVIHTVGPIWDKTKKTKQTEELSNCYSNSLSLAQQFQLSSISFPSISTGAFRFPKELAAATALRAVNNFLQTNSFGRVEITLFSQEDLTIYEQEAKELF